MSCRSRTSLLRVKKSQMPDFKRMNIFLEIPTCGVILWLSFQTIVFSCFQLNILALSIFYLFSFSSFSVGKVLQIRNSIISERASVMAIAAMTGVETVNTGRLKNFLVLWNLHISVEAWKRWIHRSCSWRNERKVKWAIQSRRIRIPHP